jgi:hypothetical protein
MDIANRLRVSRVLEVALDQRRQHHAWRPRVDTDPDARLTICPLLP